MAGDDGGKVGIALGGEHGEAVPREPEEQPGDPLLQAQPHRRGERAVEDRDPARRAAEQDRFGERTMQRRLESFDRRAGDHAISAPPPNEKNDRKKLDAANAIDRPNTIWISLRKPPLV